jgi:hypothetical protein
VNGQLRRYRITGELDVLRRNMDEFRAAQQHTTANVASLQAAQQEFQQRVSSLQGEAWYADLAALTYPTPAAKKPSATASPKQMPVVRPPSEAQDLIISQRP